jgi:hypothetical protein
MLSRGYGDLAPFLDQQWGAVVERRRSRAPGARELLLLPAGQCVPDVLFGRAVRLLCTGRNETVV